MKIFSKNMVCERCIRTVKNIFERNHFHPRNVELGEVELDDSTLGNKKELILDELEKEGFQVIEEKNAKIIESIKNAIINQIHYDSNSHKHLNYSQILEIKLLKDYSFLSSLFSETEGITIESYIIKQKIERVKELLVYNELSLSEIAFQMNYSSVAHLSAQFKKITGLTPTHFKSIKDHKRKTLDKL